MQISSQWVMLAHILRPQGRKGEVLADLLTDFPERFKDHPRVWLAAPGFTDGIPAALGQSTLPEEIKVASHWLPVGRNAGRIVLHFAGVDTIEKAKRLAGKEVVVPLAERQPLDEDAAYISDLVGCTVYDRDQSVGMVEDVQFATTPDGSRRLDEAAPLLVIATREGGEVLVPFVRAYLIQLDAAAKVIRMELPEGLTAINAAKDPAKVDKQTAI